MRTVQYLYRYLSTEIKTRVKAKIIQYLTQDLVHIHALTYMHTHSLNKSVCTTVDLG